MWLSYKGFHASKILLKQASCHSLVYILTYTNIPQIKALRKFKNALLK